jgi:hypothetical protein
MDCALHRRGDLSLYPILTAARFTGFRRFLTKPYKLKMVVSLEASGFAFSTVGNRVSSASPSSGLQARSLSSVHMTLDAHRKGVSLCFNCFLSVALNFLWRGSSLTVPVAHTDKTAFRIGVDILGKARNISFCCRSSPLVTLFCVRERVSFHSPTKQILFMVDFGAYGPGSKPHSSGQPANGDG